MQSGYRYALALTHHTQDAEDAVQTACLKLYSTYGRLKSKTLLFKAIRNLVIDQHRHHAVVEFQALEEHHHLIEPQTPTQQWYGVAADIDRLLERLRPEEREVLYLHIVEGYTAREIGKFTRHPRNTVLSLLHRGKRKLQEALSAEVDTLSAESDI